MNQRGTEIFLTGVAEAQDPLLSVKVTRDRGGYYAEVLVVHRGKRIRCCGSRWRASLSELREVACADLATHRQRHSAAWREGVLADIEKIEKRFAGMVYDQITRRYKRLPQKRAA